MLAGDPPKEPPQAPEQRESALDIVLGVGHERRVQDRVPRGPPGARELVDLACPAAAPPSARTARAAPLCLAPWPSRA